MATSTKAAARAFARLEAFGTRVSELRRELDQALVDAVTHRDDHLSNEGLVARRRELQAETREDFTERVDDLVAVRDDVLGQLHSWIEQARPHIDVSDVRQQQLWSRVKAVLDAGRTPLRALRDIDDVQTILVFRDEAPAWAIAVAAARNLEPDVEGLLRSIDDRLIELTEGAEQLALTYDKQVRVIAAAQQPMLDHLRALARNTARSHGGLEAAVQGRMAGAKASRGYREPEQAPA